MGRCWDGLFRVLTEKPPYPKQGNLTQCWPGQRSFPARREWRYLGPDAATPHASRTEFSVSCASYLRRDWQPENVHVGELALERSDIIVAIAVLTNGHEPHRETA
jgi:hypothetical protein